jgi:hypothetical protein
MDGSWLTSYGHRIAVSTPGEGYVDQRLMLDARSDLVRCAPSEDRSPMIRTRRGWCSSQNALSTQGMIRFGLRPATAMSMKRTPAASDPSARGEDRVASQERQIRTASFAGEAVAHEWQRAGEVFVEIAVVERLVHEHIGFRGAGTSPLSDPDSIPAGCNGIALAFRHAIRFWQ